MKGNRRRSPTRSGRPRTHCPIWRVSPGEGDAPWHRLRRIGTRRGRWLREVRVSQPVDELTTGYLLADIDGHEEIEVLWPPNDHVPARFSDLFSALLRRIIVEAEIGVDVAMTYDRLRKTLPSDYRTSDAYRNALRRVLGGISLWSQPSGQGGWITRCARRCPRGFVRCCLVASTHGTNDEENGPSEPPAAASWWTLQAAHISE